MISLELTQEGYAGIPAEADALEKEEVMQWAETQDASLIPHAIAMIKALKGWTDDEESGSSDGGTDGNTDGETGGEDNGEGGGE